MAGCDGWFRRLFAGDGLQGANLADLHFAGEGVFDPAPEIIRESQAYAAVGADMTGNGNELVRDPHFLENLFGSQGVMDGIEQNNVIDFLIRHGMTSLPVAAMLEVISYILETTPQARSPEMPK